MKSWLVMVSSEEKLNLIFHVFSSFSLKQSICYEKNEVSKKKHQHSELLQLWLKVILWHLSTSTMQYKHKVILQKNLKIVLFCKLFTSFFLRMRRRTVVVFGWKCPKMYAYFFRLNYLKFKYDSFSQNTTYKTVFISYL